MKNDVCMWAQPCNCGLYYTAPKIEFKLQLCVLVTVEILLHQPAHKPAKSVLGDEKKMILLMWFLRRECLKTCILYLLLRVMCGCIALFTRRWMHMSGGTLSIQWLGKLDGFSGMAGEIMLLCLSSFLVCLPQFWPFSPPSLCRPLPSFFPLSKEDRTLFPFMSPIRYEVPMTGSRLVPFSFR